MRNHLSTLLGFFVFLVSFSLSTGAAAAPSKPDILYINPPVTYLKDAQKLINPVPPTNSSVWIPNKLFVENAPPLQPEIMEAPRKSELPIYYVAVEGLNLREQPLNKSKIIKRLLFNSKVEKIDEYHRGWFQVRESKTNLTGWVYKDYLEGFILKKPRIITRSNRKSKEEPNESEGPQDDSPPPRAM
jgi:uncharacterized protein YgiM (DUF1202 family)